MFLQSRRVHAALPTRHDAATCVHLVTPPPPIYAPIHACTLPLHTTHKRPPYQIERATSFVNRILAEDNGMALLKNVGLIVIDELHMIGDPSRGYLIELLVSLVQAIETGGCYSKVTVSLAMSGLFSQPC